MASLHLSSGILESTADALRGLSRLPSTSKPNRLWPEKAPIIMAAWSSQIDQGLVYIANRKGQLGCIAWSNEIASRSRGIDSKPDLRSVTRKLVENAKSEDRQGGF
jgi:hypothetical protein